jgi:hypothetical protein
VSFSKYLLVLLLCSGKLASQARISSEEELKVLKETPLEAIYIHSNTNLFFPGEYLYYSLYCINSRTYGLSNLSRVAYVQLIGENGSVVFTHKIRLDSGKGRGDFFFPADLSSGNYKLVAFTSWMKNGGVRQFFTTDITFLNPYKSDQGVFLNKADNVPPCQQDTLTGDLVKMEAGKSVILALELKEDSYSTESEVLLHLKNYKEALGYGRYSLSVRRAEEFDRATRVTSEANSLRYPQLMKEAPQRVNDLIAVPEQRGSLISGRILDQNKRPIDGQMLAVSLPGKDIRINKVRTDREGNFFIYLNQPYSGAFGIAELLNQDNTELSFSWYHPHKWEGELPCFYAFELKQSMAEQIRLRSIHNQIENAYFEVKSDTLEPRPNIDLLEGLDRFEFELDEYRRFPTLRETFIEIINYVMVRRDPLGKSTLRVLPPTGQESTLEMLPPPLVVVDGILETDIPSLMEYDAQKVHTIKVVRDPFQLGGTKYQGIVLIETFGGQYATNWESTSGGRFTYLPSTTNKRYFRQQLPDPHIPDYRYQLLWEPDIVLEGSSESFTFYTSQVPGRYEVVLEGFTTYGKPISLKSYFEVTTREYPNFKKN